MDYAQICSKQVEKVFPWAVAFSSENLEEVAAAKRGICIQVDLSPCAGRKRFPGLELVVRLRLELKCALPITLLGWRKRLVEGSQLIKPLGPDPASRVLKDPLIQYRSLQEPLFSSSPPPEFFLPQLDLNLIEDQRLFGDMLTHIYGTEHYLEESLHTLKDLLVSYGREAEPLIRNQLPQLGHFYPGLRFSLSDLQTNLNDVFKEWPQNAEDLLFEALQEFGENALQLIHSNKIIKELPSTETHVLHIDDQEKEVEKLSTLLNPYQIEIYSAGNEEEASIILQKHPEISSVLCDYRFYEEDGSWARRHGYHLIEKLRRIFPERTFLFFTGYLHLHDLPVMEGGELLIIDKQKIYSQGGQNERLMQLVQFLHQQASLLEERKKADLPLCLQSREWLPVEVYRTYVYSQFAEDWRTAGQFAYEIVQKIKAKELTQPDLEGVFSSPKIVTLKSVKTKMAARLIGLGILQLPPRLNDKAGRQSRFEQIFRFLVRFGVNDHAEWVSIRTILNNELGFLSSKSYYWKDLQTKNLVTVQEWQWLQKYGSSLEK